jgi:uncharacterized damage-inducible protein DinB
MMMEAVSLIGHYKRLFEHVKWANARILEALKKTDGKPEKALKLFAHVLGAERVWLARLNGQDSSVHPVWPDMGLEECEKCMEENIAGYSAFLSNLTNEDLARTVTYSNTSGATFNTAIQDILTHVSMHGSYHRGQIAQAMRIEGFEPVNTDFITFVRE